MYRGNHNLSCHKLRIINPLLNRWNLKLTLLWDCLFIKYTEELGQCQWIHKAPQRMDIVNVLNMRTSVHATKPIRRGRLEFRISLYFTTLETKLSSIVTSENCMSVLSYTSLPYLLHNTQDKTSLSVQSNDLQSFHSLISVITLHFLLDKLHF